MKPYRMLSAVVLPALLLVMAAPALAAEIAPVPIGKERRARDWEGDVTYLLFSRRTASSDLVGGLGGIAFNAKDCLRCHENAPAVEGQVFYGPAFRDFTKEQWPQMLSDPEKGRIPIRDYDFFKTHTKPVKLLFDVFPEQTIKQNP